MNPLFSAAVAAAFLLGGQAAAQQQDAVTPPTAKPAVNAAEAIAPEWIRPLEVTCADLVAYPPAMLPRLVFWLDGYNVQLGRDREMIREPVDVPQAWFAIEAEQFVTACRQKPDVLAVDPIAQMRAIVSQTRAGNPNVFPEAREQIGDQGRGIR